MKLISSIAEKAVLILSVFLFIYAFREQLYTNSGVVAALEEMMSQIFPFYEPIARTLSMATDTSFTYITSLSVDGIIKDVMRIITTVLLQPLFFSAFSRAYLRMPRGISIDALEGIIESPFYKMKEAAVLAITSPLAAFLADRLTVGIYSRVELFCDGILEYAIKLAIIIGFTLLSVIWLCLEGVSLRRAFAWRWLGAFFFKIAYTVLTFGLWMYIVFAIKQADYIYIPIAIIAYVIIICVVDIFKGLAQKILIF